VALTRRALFAVILAGAAVVVAGRSGSAAGTDARVARVARGRAPPPAACSAKGPVAGPAPLLRLTDVEYRNTLHDLLPAVGEMPPDLSLPVEARTQGFLNNAEAQAPSPELIERAAANAAVVANALSDPAQVVACRPHTAAEERACGLAFVSSFGKRAFRRPLTADETARYGRFFTDTLARRGWRDSLRALLQAFLQSPNFLYRIGAGRAGLPATMRPGRAVPLTDHELASRLSYLLTATSPDAALMAEADAGRLSRPANIEAQARRLLRDPRAHAALSAFYAQWLRFDAMDNLVKSPDLYPRFDPVMAAAMKEATLKFVDHVLWDHGGTLQALLTDPHAYVNEQLAPLYGVVAPPPAGAALRLAEVDPTHRSGILTQVGLLAGLAHERSDAPVLRGVFVMDRLLCEQPPPPPRGVDTMLPEIRPGSAQTTRQQLEQSHGSADCQSCHRDIDGIGFGFENYDAIGAWRTTDNGVDVDAHGELSGTEDVDGPFTGAVELGQRLAGSAQVRRCVAAQWLGYAFGVRPAEIDPCVVRPVARAFARAKGDLRELMVAVVTSDGFRFRAVPPGADAKAGP